MSGQALYLKYRPHVFNDMIGQEHITRSLQNALALNRIRHAYLFSGPRGTGKTTMARILAKAVNCQYPDVMFRPCDQCEACVAVNEGRYLDLIEIDAASNNGVDDVRELRDKIGFAPNEGRYKVYVIDEVHRFSGAAFDALLKTLEEPPEHAIFVLATTELDKVPATIKSRCLKYEFRRVSLQEVTDRLALIADFEGLQADRDALELVARQGTGSVRDSISLLDQLLADPQERLTLDIAERILGTAGNRAVGQLVQALIDNDVAAGLDVLNGAIDEGADPRQFGGQVVDYLRNILLVQTGGPKLVDASDDQREHWQVQAAAISRSALLRAVRAFNTALADMRSSWQPQLPLELALIESTRPLVEEAPAPARSAPVKSKARSPEPAAEPEPAPEPSANHGITLGDIKRRWGEIVALAGKGNTPLAAKLAKSEPKSLDSGLLVIEIQFPALVNSMNEDKNRKALSVAIHRTLGAGFRIKAVPGREAGQVDEQVPIADDLAALVQETDAVHKIEKSD